MKNFKNIYAVIAVFVFAFSLNACQKKAAKEEGGIQVGSKVAAVWGTDSWYMATVNAVQENKYEVTYDDGTTGTVEANGIKILPADPQINVGDAVMAIWQGGAKLYSGVVTEIQGDDYLVKWDDGSDPSPVAKNKILKK